MACHLIWHPKGIEVLLLGELSFAQLNQQEKRIYADIRFNDLEFIFINGSDLVNLDASLEDIHLSAVVNLSALNSNPQVKIVFVSNSELESTFFQTYINKAKSFGSPWCFMLTQNLAKAHMWCGLN